MADQGRNSEPGSPTVVADLWRGVTQLTSAAAVLLHAAAQRTSADPLVSAVAIGIAAWLDDLARRTEDQLRSTSTPRDQITIPAPGSETYIGLLVADAVLSTSIHTGS